MRVCQLFSAAIVSLFVVAIAGCNTPSALSSAPAPASASANTPISQMMQAMQGSQANFQKLR